jgi:myo-inositol-1-phosphate synthase
MTDNDAYRMRSSQISKGTAPVGVRYSPWPVQVESPRVSYTPDYIYAKLRLDQVRVDVDLQSSRTLAKLEEQIFEFRTSRRVPRMGLLQVGWGGNNGSTLTAAIVANREKICWHSRESLCSPNYYGSVTQTASVHLGQDEHGIDVFVPLHALVPLVHPNQIVLGGWDISSANLADALERAKVLDADLRHRLRPFLEQLKPWRAAYDQNFIAQNQHSRADNVISGSKQEQLDLLREDIRRFKAENNLEKVVVVWSANSERYAELEGEAAHEPEQLLRAIRSNEQEISPSILYAVAAILEDCPYVNGSPQNTLLPSVVELARQHAVPISGNDFKSGQTRLKSVLTDFLVGCGLKPRAIVTYNHLGNNDMYQLTDGTMWRPKSVSKSGVLEDIVGSNRALFAEGEEPDHVVVVKYVPFLGDSKRDVSEYTSEAFMCGRYTNIIHNEALDSILCAPLILDTAILSELLTRVTFKLLDQEMYRPMESVAVALSFFMKSPLMPYGLPAVNALWRQRLCLENLLRALVGLGPNHELGFLKAHDEARKRRHGESIVTGT